MHKSTISIGMNGQSGSSSEYVAYCIGRLGKIDATGSMPERPKACCYKKATISEVVC